MRITRGRVAMTLFHGLLAAPLVYLFGASVAAWPLDVLTLEQLRTQFDGLANLTMLALLATLAMTPLKIVFGWSGALRLRKPLGLYTFAYAITHAGAFAADAGFAPAQLLANTTEQAFLVWGAIATLLLVPLAATSNRWSMRKLGRNWKRLHWLTYLVAVIAVVHTALIPGEPAEALLPGAILAVLFAIRLPSVRRRFATWRAAKAVPAPA